MKGYFKVTTTTICRVRYKLGHKECKEDATYCVQDVKTGAKSHQGIAKRPAAA